MSETNWKKFKKLRSPLLYLLVGILSIFIGQKIVIGAAFDWSFTTVGNYLCEGTTCTDPPSATGKVEVVPLTGIAHLKVYYSGTNYSDVSKTNFDDSSTPGGMVDTASASSPYDHVKLAKFTAAAQSTENLQTVAPFDVTSTSMTETAYIKFDEADATTTLTDSANDGGTAADDDFQRTAAGNASHPNTFAEPGGAFPTNLPTTFTNGVQFDGGDNLINNDADTASDSFSSDFTQRSISMWFKSPNTNNGVQVLFESGQGQTGGGNGGGNSIFLQNGDVNCQWWSQGGDLDGTDMNVAATAPASANVWHQVVCVLDGANSKMYLDSVDSSLISGGTGYNAQNAIALTWDSVTPTGSSLESIGYGGNTTSWELGTRGCNGSCNLGATTYMDDLVVINLPVTNDDVLTLWGMAFTKPGLWHLNESAAPFKDNSGTGFSSTSSNVTFDASGKFGRCALFGSTGNVTLATSTGTTSSLYAVTNVLTLEAFIKPGSLPSSGNTMTIVDTNPTGTLYKMMITTDSTGTYAKLGSSNTTPASLTGRIPISTSSTAGPAADGWQHIAGVWNGGKMYLYVNGALDVSTDYTGTVSSGNTGIRIGNDSGASQGFDGRIDEVAVTKRVMTPDEIAQHAGAFKAFGTYETTVSKDAGSSQTWSFIRWDEPYRYRDAVELTTSGLIHLYKMDDAAGATVADSVASGTINATATTTGSTIPTPSRSQINDGRYFNEGTSGGSNDKIASSSAYAALTNYSFDFWVRFQNATPGASDLDYLMRIGTQDPAIRRFTDGTIHVFADGADKITSKKVLRNTLWHHIAVAQQGGNMTLYIDGLSEGTATSIGASENATLNIGDNGSGGDTFLGAIDEFAVYNRGLSATEVTDHYSRGILKMNFLARSCSASNCAGISWSGPTGVNQTAPTATTNVVGMWNMDEASWNGTANEVLDASTGGCTGACDGTAKNYANTTQDALFAGGRSGDFNGDAGYVEIARNVNLEATTFSIEAWVKMDEGQLDNATIFEKEHATTAGVVSAGLYIKSDQSLVLRTNNGSGTNAEFQSTNSGVVPVQEWTHLAGTLDTAANPDKWDLYVNGTSVGTQTTGNITPVFDTTATGKAAIGKSLDANFKAFRGKIDMVKYYNAAISGATVTSRYNEGAPTNHLEGGTGSNPNLSANRYFRYKTFFRGDYGRSPEIQKVYPRTDSAPYATTDPTVEADAATGLNFSSLNSFTATPGIEQTGSVHFALKCTGTNCTDSTNWKYYDTTVSPDAANGWKTSTTYATANTAAELTPSRLGFFNYAVGADKVIWRAYFHSPTGAEQYDLDNINIDAAYVSSNLTLTAPTGQTLVVGDELDITWTMINVADVKLEYSQLGDFTDAVIITASVPAENATNGCTDPGTGAGCYRLVAGTTGVPDALGSTFKIRVSDVLGVATPSTSSSANTVNGKMVITYPVGSETLNVGTVYTILWTAYGSAGSMNGNNTRIEFDPDTSAGFGGGDVITLTSAAINGNNTNTDGSCTASSATPPIYFGCWKYAIPDNISNGNIAKMRVSDPAGTGVATQISASNGFTVTGTITPTLNPSLSGSAWKVETGTNMAGTTVDLQWSYTGSVGNLDLEFDKTGAFTGSQRVIKTGGNALNPETTNSTGCTDPGTNAGCYRLDISEVPAASELTNGAANAKFRLIAKTPNPDVTGLTGGFEVRGWYDLTTPSATATWRYGESHTIGWETHGTLVGGTTGRVLVQYNNNSGSGAWTTLNSGGGDLADGDGTHTYDWNPTEYVGCYAPERGCDKVRLRVVDKDTTTYYDYPGSGAGFDMTVLPTLTVSVAGQPAFKIDDAKNVTWAIGGLLGGNVNVYYSTNDFSGGCNPITGAGTCDVCTVQTSGSLACSNNPWTIPSNISLSVKFKITSALDSNITYTTSANRIYGEFAFTSPSGGNIYSEDSVPLSWDTVLGTIPNVHLWYSTNNFGSATLITGAGGTQNDGDYDGIGTGDTGPWTIPQTIVHDNLRFRVSEAYAYENGAYLDSANLSVSSSTPAKIRVVNPVGSDAWKIGSTQDVKWAYQGTISNIALKYCTDGSITCGSPGTIIASVAASGATGGCSLPSGNANETKGCYRWTTVGDGRSTQFVAFAHDIDAACTPSSCVTSRPKVDAGAAAMKVYNNVAVTTPNTAIQWDADTDNNVQFTVQGTMPSGFEKVDLHYSSDGGATYTGNTIVSPKTLSPVPDGTVQAYSHTWHTPTTVSTSSVKYRVRVRDNNTASYVEALDASDADFDLVARFDISAPAAAATWRIQDNKSIVWTSAGAVSKVKIEYFTGTNGWTQITQTGSEGGLPAPTATDGSGYADNTGSFVWKLPSVAGVIANDAKIRVTDMDSGHVLRTTPSASGVYNIVPAFTLVQPPQSGATWRATQTRNIQWRVIGLATNAPVKAYYSTNGSSWTEIDSGTGKVAGQNAGCTLPADGTGTEGCYNWTLPAGAVSNTAYLKITDGDATHPASDGDSANGISTQYIVGGAETITLNTPLGQTLTVNNAAMDVGWTATGPFVAAGNVSIEYTLNGSSYSTINASVDANSATNGCTLGANTGCARVTVPDAISATFKIRVCDQADGDICNTGTNNTVNGSMAIDNAPATIAVNDVVNITWSATGSTGGMAGDNTTIEYDNDGQFDGNQIVISTTAKNDVNVTGEGSCTPNGTTTAPVFYGCYKWRMGDYLSAGSQAKFRVTDGGFTASTGNSTVTGSITLTKPTGSDVWKVETATDITNAAIYVEWTYYGSIGALDLTFDKTGAFSGGQRTIKTGLVRNTNNGTSCTAPGGGGCYVLSGAELPNANELTSGAAGKFRLTASTPNPVVVGTSASSFEVRGWYNITTPGVVWSTGETSRSIQWETHGNGMGNIDLEYKLDNGSFIAVSGGTNLADSDSDTNSYTWPSVIDSRAAGACSASGIALGCDKVKLHVKQTGAGSIESQTANFTIKPRVLVTTPGTLNFQISDTSRTLAWTLDGTISSGNVAVYYSTDALWGNSCNNSTGTGKCPVCSAAAGTLSCSWSSVPNTPSQTVKFRAEAASDTTINTATSTNARIHSKFTASLPACAGSACYSENTTNLSWSQTAGDSVTVPNVRIDYTTRTDEAVWLTISASTANDGLFNGSAADGGPWQIPENVVSDFVKIRVYDATDTTFFDSKGSSSAFPVYAKLHLFAPTGGQKWNIGSAQDIQWGYQGTMSNINLKYCKNGSITCGSPVTFATVAANNSGGGCSLPSGGTYETVGCYRWTVSDDRNNQTQVFLNDADAACSPDSCSVSRPKINDGAISDMKLMENVVMTDPNTAIQVDAQKAYTVQFTARGTMPGGSEKVDLHYSSDGGGSYPGGNAIVTGKVLSPVPDNTVQTYTHSWNVPGTISTSAIKYRVRVRDNDTANFAESLDPSDADFDVVARFDFAGGSDVPQGSESWKVLTNHTIVWDSYGTVTNVKLQYSNGVIGWTDIIQSSPTQGETATDGAGIVANAGSFIWKVPNVANILKTDTKVRIIDSDSGHILRTTPIASNNFNAVANLSVIQPPQAGVTWRSTQTRVVRWKALGNNAAISTVDIQYSADADSNATTFDNPQTIKLAATHGTNADNGGCSLQGVAGNETEGCFAWVIPAGLSGDNSVYIRVKDADAGHPDSTAVSGNGVSSVFAVTPIETVTLVQPVSQTIPVGNNMDVIWDATGDLLTAGKEVKISYTTNGSSFTVMQSNVDADAATGGCALGGHTGCIRLSAPDAISATVQIKIEDQNDSDIYNLGGNNTITGAITMVSPAPPAASETYIVGNIMTIKWIVSGGSIGQANDTAIVMDTQYAGSNFSAPGMVTITTTAQNNNNGFGCVPPSATAPQYGGCYEYTLPQGTLTTNFDGAVRVTDGSYSASSDVFKLTGELVLTKPTITDVWKTETAKKIDGTTDIYVEWTYKGTAGSLGTLNLEFDKTGAFSGGQRTIASGIAVNNDPPTVCDPPASGGCYVLSGGELPTADELTGGATTAKFRLTAATPTPDVVSVVGSTPAFEVRGWYNLTQPVTSDKWFTGETTRQIKWETHGNGMGNIDLEYKLDTGGWTPFTGGTNVADSDSDTNTYNWAAVIDSRAAGACSGSGTVLGCDKVRVHVKQTGAGTYESQSGLFTIKPRIVIADPAPVTFQIADTTKTFTWTPYGTISGNVNVYYSTDSNWGNSCVSSTGAGKCPVCSAAAGVGTCGWSSVVDTPSITVKYRAEAVNDTTDVVSTTSVNARIHGKFSSGAPACTAADCFSEDTTNLTWSEVTGSTNIPNVKLYYTTNNFGSSTLISTTANDGIFNGTDAGGPWRMPENVVHDNVQVRVADANDTQFDSKGDSSAFPVKAKLNMIYPDTAQTLRIGQPADLQWGYQGTISNVTLKYCTNGTITCGSPVTITTVAANNTSGCTAPSVGAFETAGCYHWTDATSGGVADPKFNQVKIFIADADAACSPNGCSVSRPKLNDGPTANSKIVPYLSMAAPTANQELDASTAYNIQWNSQGTTLNTIDLRLSDDNGTGFSDIQLGNANTSVAGSQTLNTYNGWSTPSLISDTGVPRSYVIRVRDPDTANFVEAKSDVAVKVVAAFDTSVPADAGTDVWLVGNNYTVTWATKGGVNNVNFKFNTPLGGDRVISQPTPSQGETQTDGSNNAPNIGTFVWKVPDVTNIFTTTAKIKIIDGDSTHVLRTTPNQSSNFTIIPNFTMVKPDGTEVGATPVKAGYNFNIQWITKGTIAKPATVDLQYSLNGTFSDAVNIVTDIANGVNSGCALPTVASGETGGCYTWKVHPNAIGTNVKFRVIDSDAGDPASTLVATNGVSAAFNIVKAVKILTPNGGGGQQLTNGATYDLTWETYGSFSTVDVEYGDDSELTQASNPDIDPPMDIILNAAYNTDNGSGCTPPTPTQGGVGGCYRWTIPNDIRINLRARVYDDASATYDSSDGFWEIVGPLAMTYPNAATTFKVGDLVNITWINNQALPLESPIDLEYTPDGVTWKQVKDSSNNPAEGVVNSGAGGTFQWKVPDDISNAADLRVIKQNTPTTGDQTNEEFKILGRIDLSTLISGSNQTWFMGSPVSISWNRTGTAAGTLFNNFQLEYSPDPTFNTGVVIVDSDITLAEAGCAAADTVCDGYQWTPDENFHTVTSTPTRYIRVMDPDQIEGQVISTDRFELAGKLTMSMLGTDQTYTVGSPVSVTWDRKGLASALVFDDVDIQYSNNEFGGDTRDAVLGVVINGGGTVCNGTGNCTKTWNIPTGAALSTTAVYRLRIMDPQNPDSVTLSGGHFKLRGDFAWDQANSPTGASKWIVATEPTLEWRTVGNISNVKISYSTDNFTNQNFLMVSGGKLVSTGTTLFSAASSIANTANGITSYTLVTPDVNSGNGNFKIRVYDAGDQTSSKDTVGFKVYPQFTLLVPSPGMTGSVRFATENSTMSWSVAGTVTKAKFEYTLDGGSSWLPMTSAQTGGVLDDSGVTTNIGMINTTKTFTWILPSAKTNNIYQGQTRVSYADGAGAIDTDTTSTSPSPFKLSAKVLVGIPNGEQNPLWKVGTSQSLTWSTAPANLGGANHVDVYYSTNNGGAWTQVALDTANDGAYSGVGVNDAGPWSIPDALTNQGLIRVVDHDDVDGKDQSDANFSIAGNLNLTTPLGGNETFVYSPTPASLAVTTPVQWTSAGSAMTSVLLQYSSNSFGAEGTSGEPDGVNGCTVATGEGACLINTFNTNAVGANSFAWQVPDKIGSNWKVRVINNTAGTPSVESVSTSTFKILAGFAFTDHNLATDKCLLGQTCTLSWATAGTANNVKVEYSTAGTGGPWSLINGTNSILNGGSVDWNVDPTLSPSINVRYRLTDAQVGHPIPSGPNLEVTDASSKVVANFPAATIKARLNGSGNPFVTIGGQTWGVGQSIDVTYNYTGIVGAVKVYYSLDNFATSTDITPSISNSSTNGDGTGSFSYQFTDLMAGGTNTTNVKFLITDAAVPDLAGNTTNGITTGFKLKAVFNITNPSLGTERWVVGQNATVAWTATGSAANVKIIYDDNATFLSPSTIIASTPSVANVGGSYTFQVNTANLPDLDSAPLYHKTIYVRVLDADGEGVSGAPVHGGSQVDSVKAHKIVGRVDLTGGTASPQTGAKWPVGSAQTVTWATYGKITAVDIYYDSTGDGVFDGDEVQIANNIAANPGTNTTGADTSYSWSNMATTLPLNAVYRMWVVDHDDNTTPESASYKVTGPSNAFKIYGYVDTIVLTSPNGTLKHKASDAATITWSTTGSNLTKVDIQYRDLAGSNPYLGGAWQTIELGHDNTAGNRGTKSWNIPAVFNSSAVQVRVRPVLVPVDDGTTDGFDVLSNQKFMPKIVVGTIPNGGQLKIGTSYNIPWTITGIISNIRVRYSPDPGTLGYLNDSAPYNYVIAASINPNNGPYALSGANAKVSWQDAQTGGVEDTRSNNLAKIKIENLDDVTGDADAESALFSIQATFNLKSPVDTSELSVGDNFPLTWDWGGTLPYAVVEISNTYTGTLASFDAGKKCLKDFSRTDCTDSDEDANQNGILDNGEDANNNNQLDYGMLVKNGNGPSGTNFVPENIQVQDWISRPGDPNGQDPFFIKISDPGDPNVYHIYPTAAGGGVTANKGFKIKSKLDVTSPDGGQDWLVGNVADPNNLTESLYKVTWTHTGTVNDAVLQAVIGNGTHEDLDNDNIMDPGEDTNGDGVLDRIICVNGGTYPNCTSIPNSHYYAWKIPDNGKIIFWNCNKLPDVPGDTHHPCKAENVKLRVLDASDSNNWNDSQSDLTVRYTAKLWEFVNDKTGKALDTINMTTNGIHGRPGYSLFDMVQVSAIKSPFVIWNPAGTGPYEIEFKKDGFTSYGDAGQVTATTDQVGPLDILPANSPNHVMVDEKQRVKLADILAHNDLIKIEYKYTDTTKDLNIETSYSRDGVTVVTTRGVKVDIMDGNTLLATKSAGVQNLEDSALGGVYDLKFTSADVTLSSTKLYTIVSTITIDDTPGQESSLYGITTLNIAPFVESQKTDANVATITPIITNNLDTKLSTAVQTIESKIDAAQAAIDNKIGTDPNGKSLMQKMDDQTGIIKDAINDFVEKSDDAVFKMQDEITKGAIRLIIPGTTKVGFNETIRVAMESGQTPAVDMICPDGKLIIGGLALPETTTEGIYAANVSFDPNRFKCAIAKAVTVVATATVASKDPGDPAFQVTAVGSIFLTSTTLDDVQAMAAAGLNAEKAAKEAREAVEKVAAALAGRGNVMESLNNLQKSVDRLPSLLGSSQSGMSQMKATLEDVSNRLGTFMGHDGYDMRTILKQEIGEGMKGMRNKVDRTLAATEVMKQIVVAKSEEPIVQTFYEIGSVKLRVVAVNPSKEKPQVVPIKIYLPKEVIPDDIIEMGELKVGYDSTKGLYYAYSDSVQLAPQETRVFEVHLEDVWKIKDEEIKKIQERTGLALKHLEKTEHYANAKAIVDSINSRLNEIQVKQNDESISREEHIGNYRMSLLTMQQIKEDITLLEKMLMHSGGPPSVEFLKDTVFEKKDDIDRITAWKLILGIIGFLGLLGVGFYFRWFLLLKAKPGAKAAKAFAPKVNERLDEMSGLKNKIEAASEAEEIDIEKLLGDKDERKAG